MNDFPEIPSSSWQELLLFFLRRRWKVRVAGHSMYPTLKEGDQVLVDRRAYRNQRPQVGDVIVFAHPHKPQIRAIKRVATVGTGAVSVEGDNLVHSTDSRTSGYGSIQDGQILGKVTVCL